MPWALPFTALFTSLGLEITRWGQGRFNWGPRLGSLFLLVFGQVAFKGTTVGAWLTKGVQLLAHWADVGVSYLLGSSAGTAIAYLVSWLPVALLGAYWLVALSPWGKERMTWRLAWAGMLIPTFLAAVPGPAGNALTVAFTFLAGIGAAIIGGLFAMASGVKGLA